MAAVAAAAVDVARDLLELPPRPVPVPTLASSASASAHSPFLQQVRADGMAKTTQYPLNQQSLLYMALLAVQFGVQPILTRRYTPQGITRSTVILAQEITKLVLAGVMLYVTTGGKPVQTAMKGWTVANWIEVAGVPAALYAVQNMAALKAYQNLDALTFNVLNQTKTLSAALCCYLIMGRRQSKVQIFSLVLLLLSALVMEKIVKVNDLLYYVSYDYWFGDWSWATANAEAANATDTDMGIRDASSLPDPTTQTWDAARFASGVAPILLASFISGLAGALSQMNLQKAGGGRNPYLFSMELCVASVLILGASLFVSPDGTKIVEKGFFHGWTPGTLIPLATNSVGGVLVGLVTKFAGSVRKGFALIFGILISGLIQAWSGHVGVTREQIIGGLLAGLSLYLHATNPPLKSAPGAATMASSVYATASAAAIADTAVKPTRVKQE